MLITNGKGSSQELAEAVAKKFGGTKIRKWRVFAIGPEKIDNASYNFKIDLSTTIPKNTMESLRKEFIDFTYEVDTIIDLSSEIPNSKNKVDLKNSEEIFDQYETMKNDRLIPAMLASSMAAHFLSPNGYLAFSANFDSLTPPNDKKLVQPNFLNLIASRVIM